MKSFSFSEFPYSQCKMELNMVTASYDLGQTVDTGTEPGVCVHSCYPLCANTLATRSFTPAQVPLPTFFLFLFYPSL